MSGQWLRILAVFTLFSIQFIFAADHADTAPATYPTGPSVVLKQEQNEQGEKWFFPGAGVGWFEKRYARPFMEAVELNDEKANKDRATATNLAKITAEHWARLDDKGMDDVDGKLKKQFETAMGESGKDWVVKLRFLGYELAADRELWNSRKKGDGPEVLTQTLADLEKLGVFNALSKESVERFLKDFKPAYLTERDQNKSWLEKANAAAEQIKSGNSNPATAKELIGKLNPGALGSFMANALKNGGEQMQAFARNLAWMFSHTDPATGERSLKADVGGQEKILGLGKTPAEFKTNLARAPEFFSSNPGAKLIPPGGSVAEPKETGATSSTGLDKQQVVTIFFGTDGKSGACGSCHGTGRAPSLSASDLDKTNKVRDMFNQIQSGDMPRPRGTNFPEKAQVLAWLQSKL